MESLVYFAWIAWVIIAVVYPKVGAVLTAIAMAGLLFLAVLIAAPSSERDFAGLGMAAVVYFGAVAAIPGTIAVVRLATRRRPVAHAYAPYGGPPHMAYPPVYPPDPATGAAPAGCGEVTTTAVGDPPANHEPSG